MPQRIEDTLFVIESFKSDGVEYRPGDRVPLRHRRVRELAAERPELFRMEYSTEPVDLKWPAGLEAGFAKKYQTVKRYRESQKDRQERALRDELAEQNHGQPELERRFKKQEAERRKREEEAREEREREALEREIDVAGDLRSGFHFQKEKTWLREPIVIVVGARPVEYQRRIVRDKRSGKLAEIDIHELPPVDPGAPGVSYAFRQGEKVSADHPAVAACPGAFIPAMDE